MANYYGGMMGAMGGDIGNAAAVDVAGIFKKKMQQTDPRLQTGYEQQLEFNTLRNRKEAFDKLKKDIGGIGDGLVNIPGAAGNIAGISFDINESPKNRKMRAIKNLSETGVGGEKEAAIEKLKQMGGPQLPLVMGNPLYQMGNMAGMYGANV